MISCKCRTCGKTVYDKNGKLSCCGITEDTKESMAENRQHSRSVAKALRPLFDPVIPHWRSDDEEEGHDDPYDYEGIPNT